MFKETHMLGTLSIGFVQKVRNCKSPSRFFPTSGCIINIQGQSRYENFTVKPQIVYDSGNKMCYEYGQSLIVFVPEHRNNSIF